MGKHHNKKSSKHSKNHSKQNSNTNELSQKLGELGKLNSEHANIPFLDYYNADEKLLSLEQRHRSALLSLKTIFDKINNPSATIEGLQSALDHIQFHQKQLDKYCKNLETEINELKKINTNFSHLYNSIKRLHNNNPSYKINKKNKEVIEKAESNMAQLDELINTRTEHHNYIVSSMPQNAQEIITQRISDLEKQEAKNLLHDSINKYLAARAIKYSFFDTLDSIICTIAACFNPAITTEQSKRENFAKELKTQISDYVDNKNDKSKQTLLTKLDHGINFFKPRNENNGKGSFKETLSQIKNKIK